MKLRKPSHLRQRHIQKVPRNKPNHQYPRPPPHCKILSCGFLGMTPFGPHNYSGRKVHSVVSLPHHRSADGEGKWPSRGLSAQVAGGSSRVWEPGKGQDKSASNATSTPSAKPAAGLRSARSCGRHRVHGTGDTKPRGDPSQRRSPAPGPARPRPESCLLGILLPPLPTLGGKACAPEWQGFPHSVTSSAWFHTAVSYCPSSATPALPKEATTRQMGLFILN